MTNEELLMGKTIKELISWINEMISDCDCNNFPCSKYCDGRPCNEAWLAWLKQEADT